MLRQQGNEDWLPSFGASCVLWTLDFLIFWNLTIVSAILVLGKEHLLVSFSTAIHFPVSA